MIDGSASNGITTEDANGCFTAFEGNTIKNSGKAPIYVYSSIWSLRNISEDNTFTGNINNYIHVRLAGSITANMTLKKMSIPYRLYGSRFQVNGEATFTVEKGVEIQFGDTSSGIYITSAAAIVMDGTEEKPITLKGITNTKGSWGNIEIQSNREENKLNYVNIINGGSGGQSYSSALYLYNGSASVTNCVIDGSASNGITTEDANGYFTVFEGNTIINSGKAPMYVYSSIWSLRNISGDNTFTGNTNDYIYIRINAVGIPQNGALTLRKMDVPYYLNGGLQITTDSTTLTIEPGTQIWVGSAQGIYVGDNSKLIAKGTEDERIVFRGTTDQAGWWYGIRIDTDLEGTEIAYCDISGGGRDDNSGNTCLHIYNATIELKDVKISKSLRYGIGLEGTNKIWSEDVTFETCALGNVWYHYSGPIVDALPANDFFMPETPIL